MPPRTRAAAVATPSGSAPAASDSGMTATETALLLAALWLPVGGYFVAGWGGALVGEAMTGSVWLLTRGDR